MKNEASRDWSFVQKLVFRFFFIYFLLHITPWLWLDSIVRGIDYISGYYQKLVNWVIEKSNHFFFHFEVKKL